MHPIQRQKIKKDKGIAVTTYIPPKESGLSKLVFKASVELVPSFNEPESLALNFLWHTAIILKDIERPGWSGYMSNVSVGKYPGKSIVNLLPIIDLDPSNMSCIYSTINFVIDQAKRLNIETPVLTFDQPLWLKVAEIINVKSIRIVLILVGFHLIMSFLGSIGKLMKGSEISEALQTVYGKNAVEHMMSGKAVTRAIRGHFRTSSALFTKLISPIFQASFDQNNNQHDNDIYVNNTRNVSEENDNSDLDYFKEENDEKTIINTDDQLSESEITILGELYKIIEKTP